MLAQFVYKYLQIYWLKLAGHERNKQEELEQSILYAVITQSDSLINC